MALIRFHERLRSHILETILKRQEDLAAGLATDFADYKARASYIKALNDVLQMCEDLEKELI